MAVLATAMCGTIWLLQRTPLEKRNHYAGTNITRV
jgi:hypothetical protein